MKKILLYFAIVLIGVLFVFGFYFHSIDSARVRNGVEPKFTIKVVSDGGSKVTYWGLGYKVIRYTKISPSEPYKNNIGVKYGSWFMKYELDNNSKIIEIVDTTKNIKDFACAEALEEFYEDDEYVYYYNCIKSSYVLVRYEDGSQMTVEEALRYGNISIKDLDEYEINYIKETKELSNTYINDYRLMLKRNNNCVTPKKYYTDEDRDVYLLCFDEITLVKDDINMSLKYYFQNINQTFENSIQDIIDELKLYSMLKDGGTKIYKNEDITLILCNTLDGNKDIYLGNSDIEYKQNYCK